MKRSSWLRRFKANYVHGVIDIMNELGICRNTVSNHIRQGLWPIGPGMKCKPKFASEPRLAGSNI